MPGATGATGTTGTTGATGATGLAGLTVVKTASPILIGNSTGENTTTTVNCGGTLHALGGGYEITSSSSTPRATGAVSKPNATDTDWTGHRLPVELQREHQLLRHGVRDLRLTLR